MPRAPRLKSHSGIYHIILRGTNQQVIFEDEEDYLKFIETLEKYKAVSEYKVFAYCLMSNHIHILIKVGKEDLDLIMKRIAGSYVYWYNWKYYRRGHLFQDRFKSEPIEDDSYFLTVLRYIHQNPVKAGIVKSIDQYKYSSYNDYIEKANSIIDAEFALSLIGKESFAEFNNEPNNDVCIEIEERNFRLSDADAKKIINKISKCDNATEFQKLKLEKQVKYIGEFLEQGLSIRQINRLTGISKGLVEKISKGQ